MKRNPGVSPHNVSVGSGHGLVPGMALEKEGQDSDADSERSNQVPSLERSDDEEAPEELKATSTKSGRPNTCRT